MSKENRKYLLVLIVLHLAIALPLAYFLNIWADEGSTLYTTGRGIGFAFKNALADEKQAPLYFWFLSLWREINHSIFFARLFSVVCSAAAIWFFYDLARKIFAGKSAILMAAFFAAHPYLIWASLEIRVYSPVILLSVVILKFFYEDFFNVEANGAKRTRFRFALLAIVALYTNYYLGFLLVGNFAVLLILRKWSAAKSYFWQMLIVGAAVTPLLWWIKSQFSANAGSFQAEKSVGEGLRILWNFFLTFVLPTEILPPEDSTSVSVARLWLMRLAILAGIGLFFRQRRKLSAEETVFGTIAATVSAFLLLAYYLLGAGFVEIRHAAVLFAPLILFVGLFSANLLPEKDEADGANKFNSTRVFKFSLTIITATFFIYGIYALYPNLTKRGDWEKVGAFIEENEKPSQPLVVFTAFDAPALSYQYHGANRILPDRKFFDWGIEAETGSADSWRRQTEFIISEIPADAPEIWLLTSEKCRVERACEPLENFVRANYTVIEEKDFYKEKVRLLRRKLNDRND